MKLTELTDDEIFYEALSYLPEGLDLEAAYDSYREGEIDGAVIDILVTGLEAGCDVSGLTRYLLGLWRRGDTHDILESIARDENVKF